MIETVSPPGIQLKNAWSPSSLNTFMQCSLRYWFEKVARWETWPSEAQVAGNIVHAVLEDLLGLPVGNRSREAANLSYIHQFDRHTEGIKDAIDINNVRERSYTALEGYFQTEDPNRVRLVTDGIERRIAGELQGVAMEGWIDRIEQSETGLRIVDYKTGIPKLQYLSRYWRQQMLYAAGWNQTTPGNGVTEVALFYVAEEPRVLVRPVTKFATTKVSDELKQANEARNHYHAESRWRATTGPLCRYCPFEIACPAKRKRAPLPGSQESEAKLAENPDIYKRKPRCAGGPSRRSGGGA